MTIGTSPHPPATLPRTPSPACGGGFLIATAPPYSPSLALPPPFPPPQAGEGQGGGGGGLGWGLMALP
jgi:hypothetical protein